MGDYLAMLNLEGKRNVWLKNHSKIEYVFTKSKEYLKPGMRVCEIGIGDGHLLRLLTSANLSATGIDSSNYLIKKLGTIFTDEKLEIDLLEHDISKPIDLENAFDAVFCLDVLEHVEKIEKAIENTKQILKNGGILVATLPWKEILDNNMVMCPKCNHKFHKVGHFHSFQCYDNIIQMLGDDYHILAFGFVKPIGLKYTSIDILKKTIFRRKFHGAPYLLSQSFLLIDSIYN